MEVGKVEGEEAIGSLQKLKYRTDSSCGQEDHMKWNKEKETNPY